MRQETNKTLSTEEMADIAVEFENREFTADELLRIRATRRTVARIDSPEATREAQRSQHDVGGMSL